MVYLIEAILVVPTMAPQLNKQANSLSGMASERRIAQVATTIPVRNVQALAAACGTHELTADEFERYIRPDIDRDVVLDDGGDVPVVDLGWLLNPESLEEEAARLRFACEEWGFFQVKNAYAQRPGDVQGYGQAYVVSNDQKFDWSDMLFIVTQPHPARDMTLWPTQPFTFRKSLQDYSFERKKLTHSVVTAIGKALNIDPELLVDKYAVQGLRMNYYPPCISMPEKVNSVEGPQIRRHGAWIPVKPHPKALLVNVSDFLEIMTNGKYKSIEHRVTINARKARLTISAFHNPKFDGVISPIMGSTTENVLYKTVSVEQTRWKESVGLCEGLPIIRNNNSFSIVYF